MSSYTLVRPFLFSKEVLQLSLRVAHTEKSNQVGESFSPRAQPPSSNAKIAYRCLLYDSVLEYARDGALGNCGMSADACPHFP